MAIATLAQRNALVTAYTAAAPYGALFTADPGTSGTVTGEVTGGSPAYARKALNWSAASASASTGSGVFDVPSGRLWAQVLRELGGRYAWLALEAGDPGSN